jgi:hypothetical protein
MLFLLVGYTKRPQSAAALVLFFVWWVFSLVVFAFYVSGIMRSGIYEAVPDKVAKFKSFNNLVEQQKIKYGAVKAGSTVQFFRLSKIVVRCVFEIISQSVSAEAHIIKFMASFKDVFQ